MKFFYAPGSCALASHIALAETGAAYEAVRVDFDAAEQRGPDFLSINPKGRVPALVVERGILTETPAILLYVAQTFPDADLAPLDDPFELGQVQAFNSYLCSTVHVAHAHKGRAYRWADSEEAMAEMQRKVPANVRECFELIESEFLRGPWVMGERYTICDPYLYTIGSWLERVGIDRADLPKVDAHGRLMEERPRVQRALAEHFG